MAMNKYLLFSFIVLVGLTASKPIESTSLVKWITFEEAMALNKEKPKKLLIDLYTDWCGWCKVMDRETYNHATIANYINENFYPVKFNAEQREDVEFNGNTLKFVSSGRRGYHELAAALTDNRLSYPTTVFMDENLRVIQPVAGYLKPKQMEPILVYIGDGHYKNTDWENFRKNHKSSL